MKKPRITILDLGLFESGTSASQALRDLVRTAPLLESLGYERLWIAEHHEKHFCYSVPEVVIAAAASVTEHLRLGVAGVLMHFHSPLRVAETYRALAALFPNRIDLGLASGLTGDPQIRHALSPGFELADALEKRLYATRVRELFSYLENRVAFENPLYAGPPPIDQVMPPVVMLGGGSGIGNMTLASELGTAFCYSLTHGKTTNGVRIMEQYRERFQPRESSQAPVCMIAANVLCGKSMFEAYSMYSQIQIAVPGLQANIVGDPLHCRGRIEGLLRKYGCDEIVLFPLYSQRKQKEDAYRALADVLELQPRKAHLKSVVNGSTHNSLMADLTSACMAT